MRKKYMVRLSDAEREILQEVIRRQKGSAMKVRRAQILLKADANGPNWTDAKIVEAFGCRRQTVEMLRERLVTAGFEEALNGKKKPPKPTKLDGVQEAKVIALRLGSPPAGYANWTLKLLADRVVALEIVDSISYETVLRTLKKTVSRRRRSRHYGSVRPENASMRFKLIATALGLGLFAFVGTDRASAQSYAGYGNGNHDLSPHGHTTQTPFGVYSYYGNGLHDLRQHGHTADPYNGVTSYSNGLFRSTQSYNGFRGYSGFGSYNSGYRGYSGGFNRGYGRRFNRW